jgi:hypothetical protein
MSDVPEEFNNDKVEPQAEYDTSTAAFVSSYRKFNGWKRLGLLT